MWGDSASCANPPAHTAHSQDKNSNTWKIRPQWKTLYKIKACKIVEMPYKKKDRRHDLL